MHPQYGHGFPPNFQQPPMLPLRGHPMLHGATPPPPPGQFNMGPPPPFGVRNFSPSLLGPGSVHTAEFSPSDGSVRTNTSPLPSDLPGLMGASDRVTSPPHFDSTASSSIGVTSPTVSSTSVSGAGAGTGIGTGSGVGTGASFATVSGALQHPLPGSPSQQYPFMTPLGPIGKAHPIHHSGPGFLSGTSGVIPFSGIGTTGEDDFVPLSVGGHPHLYPFGSTNDDGVENTLKLEANEDLRHAHVDHGNINFPPGFY
ncbi:hypothetical protein BGZ65_009251, partial [Modicella reniformis]